MEYNHHRITQIKKVNNKNIVLSFFISERLFQYPSRYWTDKWLNYSNWCEINSTIENIDQTEFTKILNENDKSILRHIPESHIVLKITPKKVTSKLIEAVQLILNNGNIEFNCYLEVDIKYDPDYAILTLCDSGLSFDQKETETERISSYSPTQQQHDKYTPQPIESNSASSSMEISPPVYNPNTIQKSVEEYVPEGKNSNSIVYTPSKVSNKKHDGYSPVNPISISKENNNDAIVYIPAKSNVTKRSNSAKSPPSNNSPISEKRNTRSSSISPIKKMITKLPATIITKSPTLSTSKNEKPSTSTKRSSSKDSDFTEPLEKKPKQKINEKKTTSSNRYNKLFGTDVFDSSQDSDCNSIEVIENKSLDFFDNEELLSQTSRVSNKSPDLFEDTDIGPSQDNEELLELKIKEMLERYPEQPTSTLDTSSTKTHSSKSRSRSRRKPEKNDYVSEKKLMGSFLVKKPDDSKGTSPDEVLRSWISTKMIEPDDSSKKNKESSKRVKTKGPTKAERNQRDTERSKLLVESTKELERIKELKNKFISNEKEEEKQKVEVLSLNNIDLETFVAYIHKKKKLFNKIFAEYCLQKTHKVNQHEVNFLIIPKLMDENKHLAVIQEFSSIYHKDEDNFAVLDKYQDLYFEQMMPELILLISMKHHHMSREEAISRINKQSQYFSCSSQLEDTFF